MNWRRVSREIVKRKLNRKSWIAASCAAVLVIAGAAFFMASGRQNAGNARGSVILTLDGKETAELPRAGAGTEKTVIITLDGQEIGSFPFGEEHVIRIRQETGENTVRMTADSVWMEDADCPGKDCVQMEKMTADNLESRIMGAFIICLPHRLAIEIRQ